MQNTGTVDAYIRVRLVAYWQDSKGNTVSKTAEQPTFALGENWLYNSNQKIYYYALPVRPGDYTKDLLAENQTVVLDYTFEEYLTIPDQANSPTVKYEYYEVVEVLAEAIQSEPSEAAANSWKLVIENNVITGFKAN